MTVYAITVTACAFFFFGFLSGACFREKKRKAEKPRANKKRADVKNEYRSFLNYDGNEQN